MQDNYKIIEEYNLGKNERKVLIVFEGIIADMIDNKILNLVITELFIRGRKLKISIAFITQSIFSRDKRCYTKLYTLFYYENSKQKKTSTNCTKSFIRC